MGLFNSKENHGFSLLLNNSNKNYAFIKIKRVHYYANRHVMYSGFNKTHHYNFSFVKLRLINALYLVYDDVIFDYNIITNYYDKISSQHKYKKLIIDTQNDTVLILNDDLCPIYLIDSSKKCSFVIYGPSIDVLKEYHMTNIVKYIKK